MAAEGLLGTCGELFVGEEYVDGAGWDVDLDDVAVHEFADVASAGCLGGDVTNAESAGAATEAAVGDEGALLAEVHALDVGGGVEHLLHAGSALGSFVGDDDDVAGLDSSAEDALAGVFLAVEDDGGTAEVPDTLIDAGGLDDAAVLGDVAEEHGEAAIARVGVLDVADAAGGAVGVVVGVVVLLGAELVAEAAARGGEVDGGGGDVRANTRGTKPTSGGGGR